MIDVAKSLQNLLFQTSPEVPGHSSKGPHSNSSFFSYQPGTLGKSLDLKSLAFLICRTWTMWRQLSLSPLMDVGFRHHIHTTHRTQHTRRENAVTVTATQVMEHHVETKRPGGETQAQAASLAFQLLSSLSSIFSRVKQGGESVTEPSLSLPAQKSQSADLRSWRSKGIVYCRAPGKGVRTANAQFSSAESLSRV